MSDSKDGRAVAVEQDEEDMDAGGTVVTVLEEDVEGRAACE